MSDLKKCPFCGGIPRVTGTGQTEGVFCSDCGGYGPSKDKWNARKELELSMCESIKTSPSMSEDNQRFLMFFCFIAVVIIGISICGVVAQFAPKKCDRQCGSEVVK